MDVGVGVSGLGAQGLRFSVSSAGFNVPGCPPTRADEPEMLGSQIPIPLTINIPINIYDN